MKLDINNIYFSFADGVIDYQCSECTALCCRGFGMQLSVKRDLPLMSKQYPTVAAFALWRQGDQLFLNTPVTGCSLLRGTYCGVEEAFGKPHKPVGCTLFPFNNLFRVGDRLIVALHHICPLRLTLPARPGNVQGTHALIASTIQDLGICADDVMPSWVTEIKRPPKHSEDAYLKREENFRNRCAAGFRGETFLDVLLECSEDRTALRRFLKRVSRLMGWKCRFPAKPDAIDDLLLALAPTLRVLESAREPEQHLRMLGLLAIQARDTFALSNEPVQLKSIYGLFLQCRNVFRFLAYEDDCLKPAGKAQAVLNAPGNLMARVVAMRHIPADGVLGALERSFEQVKSLSDRYTILYDLVSMRWIRT